MLSENEDEGEEGEEVVGQVYFWRSVKKRRVSVAVRDTNVYSLSVRLYEACVSHSDFYF